MQLPLIGICAVEDVVTFEYLPEIPREIEDEIETHHQIYEQNCGVSCNYTPFSIVAKVDDVSVGALSGYTCYEEVYVDDLIVFESHRNMGIGSKLMQEVEAKFSKRNFRNINLVTNEFQAPNFYLRCGYTVEFIRVNKENPRLTKYFFIKYLD